MASTPVRNPPSPPAPDAPNPSTARNALVVIAVILVGAAIYWLRDILMPLALAIFLLIMIDSFVRTLKAKAPMMPEWAAAPIVLTIVIAGFVGLAVLVAENAGDFVGQLKGYGPRLNGLIERVAGLAGVDAPPSIDQLFERLNPTRYVGTLAQTLQDFTSNAVFVLIYVGFLVASRAGFEKKVVRLFPERSDRQEAVAVFHRIRDGVERYLWIQTVTGAVVAFGSWVVMAAVGLDNAIFWAFLIFVTGYIPIVGGLIGGVFPPLFALVQYDTLWQAGVVFAGLNAINFVISNLVLPRIQGDSLNLDPVVILLALAFWGALLGAPGMFLSTPLTVMAMVILAEFPHARWIAILLSGDGNPMSQSKPAKAFQPSDQD